jgi:hypothetical protein
MRASVSDIGLLAALGTVVGGYAALGVGFYWLMQPTILENAGSAAYKPPPATIVVYPDAPFIPPAHDPSVSPPAAAIEPPVAAAFAAAVPEVEEKPATVVPKHIPPHRERTTYRHEPHASPGRNSGGSPYEFRSVW